MQRESSVLRGVKRRERKKMHITLRQNVWKLKDDGLCILRIRSTRQSDDCCNQHCGTVHHERCLKYVAIEKRVRANLFINF